MLALIADLGTGILSAVKGFSPVQAAVLLTTFILLVDVLLRGYLAARRSPFIFSEEDAALICQAPVDRRQVALAWLLGDWIPAGLPYWAGAVTLSFACQQLAASGGLIWGRLPIYLLSGLRATSLMLPLHLAFMASTYAFGALRLQRDKELTYLRLVPVGIGAGGLLLTILYPESLPIMLWPVLYPLEAGFGAASWISGLTLAVFLTVLSLLALYLVSPGLNLSRASQESNLHWKTQPAGLAGSQTEKRQRIKAGHYASHIQSRAGVWALIWKDWLQTSRGFDIRYATSWLALFAAGLGMLIAPDWGTRTWIFVVWGLLIGQVCSKRFSSDLNLWMLFRQLPFSGKEILLCEIVSPVVAATLLGWVAFGVCNLIRFHPSLPVALLAPGIILCITLAAVFDILRQSKADALLAGSSSEMGAAGLFFGLILAGLPLVVVMWITSRISAGYIVWVVSLLGLLLGLGIAYGLWHLTTWQYKNVN